MADQFGEIGEPHSTQSPPHDKLFRFIRYDVRLELEWLYPKVKAKQIEERRENIRKEFGGDLTETDMIRMRSLDDTTIIPDLYKLARIIAKEQVKEEHWTGDLARWCDGAARRRRRRAGRCRRPRPTATRARCATAP